MTDTKPTPRTDAFVDKVWDAEKLKNPIREYNDLADFARTLERELAAIKSQPVPVEPELIPECSYCGLTQAVTLKSYDSLKQQLQVAQQERDGYLDLNRDCAELALNHLERAEKAEAELASLRLELARLDGEIPYGN